MGRPSTTRFDGHLHDHLYSSHDRCHGRSSLPRIRIFRTAAVDILFQHYFQCSDWPGSLSQPSYEDVFPERNHPTVVSGREPGGFLHSLAHSGWLYGLLQSFADLAFALCDTDRGHHAAFAAAIALVFFAGHVRFPHVWLAMAFRLTGWV